MSGNLPVDSKSFSQTDNDALSEFSSTSFSTEPQSSRTASTRSVSELNPDDSASHRRVQTMAERARSVTSSLMTGTLTSASGNLYQVIGERVFSSQSDVYALPADEEEHSRLDMQHFAYGLWMDSLYPFKTLVRHTLRKGQTPPPEILDVGTGSGRWAVDMAVSFPHAKVVGLDLVPPASLDTSTVPSNCHFEIDDMNLSMERHQSVFSVVHARLVETGLNDPESFSYEMARALRPGGVLIVGSVDMQVYDENKQPFPWVEPGQPGFRWHQYICGHIYRSYLTRGSVGLNSILWWKEWLDSNPNFTNVAKEDVWIPLGPWKEGPRTCHVSRLCTAHRHLLSSEGHSDEDIEHWTAETKRELRDMTSRTYFHGVFFGGVRNDEPWQERPMRVAPEDLLARSTILGAAITKPWVTDDSDSGVGSAPIL